MKFFKLILILLIFVRFQSCTAGQKKKQNTENFTDSKIQSNEPETQKFKRKIFSANKNIKYFYAKFSISGKVNKKKYNALGKLWVDNKNDRIKIIITDPVFESLINTMLIENDTAFLYDHLRRENFSLPIQYLRIDSFMGDRLSFSSLKPIIQNKLPKMLSKSKFCRYYPKDGRIYYSDDYIESVFDFQKNHLARIVVRDKKQNNKILMLLKNRRKIKGFSFPYYIGIKDENSKDYIQLKFFYVSIKKNISSKVFTVPGKK